MGRIIDIVLLSVLGILFVWAIVGFIRFEIWYHDHKRLKF